MAEVLTGGGRDGDGRREPEHRRVRSWRYERFSELGYEPAVADRLARSRVDTHRLAELLESGCSRELALEILL